MGQATAIEWTATVNADGSSTQGASWNPIRARRKDNGKQGWACVKVSPGCANCYAENLNGRNLPECGTGLDYTVPALAQVEFFIDEKTLEQPLRWKRPRKIFVGSMTDLFGEFVPDAFIDRIFAVMALSPQHTFIVLTKRAKRMREWFTTDRPKILNDLIIRPGGVPDGWSHHAAFVQRDGIHGWPLPNVWLGVSVEDQQRADERIPDLLMTPAAVRWVSYEPALGPVDFYRITELLGRNSSRTFSALEYVDPLNLGRARPTLDWIVVGGESGPGARPFEIAWARDTIRQCRAAGVRCFVKQMGAVPIIAGARQHHYDFGEAIGRKAKFSEFEGERWRVHLKNRKGSDMAEWPEDLRVREFPEVRA